MTTKEKIIKYLFKKAIMCSKKIEMYLDKHKENNKVIDATIEKNMDIVCEQSAINEGNFKTLKVDPEKLLKAGKEIFKMYFKIFTDTNILMAKYNLKKLTLYRTLLDIINKL